MKLTEKQLDEAKSKIRTIANQVTDTYTQNNTSDMNVLMEKKKLTLWITGLATALEVFLVNRYSWNELNGVLVILFIASIVLFMMNALGTLYLNKIVTNLYFQSSKKCQQFNLQRLKILIALEQNDSLQDQLLKDFESRELSEKLIDLDYLEGKKFSKKSILKLGRFLTLNSDDNASFLLILQICVMIALFIIS